MTDQATATAPVVKFETPAPYVVPATAKRRIKELTDEAIVQQAMEIIRRSMVTRDVFGSPDAVKNYLQLQIARKDHEVFCVLYLDAQNRLIKFEEAFKGTLTQTSVYPREIVKRSLELGAAAVVMAHNHPSGTVQPSRADEALTQTLKAALALIDVRVLDHVIVAPGQSLSMAEKGLL